MSRQFICAIVLAIASTLTTATALAVEDQPNQIFWSDDPQLALTQSRNMQLPILVYATSERCGYCRKMERETWANPDIVQQVEADFVPLRIDAKRDAGLISKLRVRAYPTTVLIAPDGRIITGAEGYQAPGELSGMLRSLRRTETATQTVSFPR